MRIATPLNVSNVSKINGKLMKKQLLNGINRSMTKQTKRIFKGIQQTGKFPNEDYRLLIGNKLFENGEKGLASIGKVEQFKPIKFLAQGSSTMQIKLAIMDAIAMMKSLSPTLTGNYRNKFKLNINKTIKPLSSLITLNNLKATDRIYITNTADYALNVETRTARSLKALKVNVGRKKKKYYGPFNKTATRMNRNKKYPDLSFKWAVFPIKETGKRYVTKGRLYKQPYLYPHMRIKLGKGKR